MIRKILTNKIIKLRKINNLSQVKLAKIIGVAPSYVNRVEKKKYLLSMEQIEAACKALNYPIAELFKNVEAEELGIAEPPGPEYGDREEWEAYQRMPKLQELLNIFMGLPEEKQEMLLNSWLPAVKYMTTEEEKGNTDEKD